MTNLILLKETLSLVIIANNLVTEQKSVEKDFLTKKNTLDEIKDNKFDIDFRGKGDNPTNQGNC